MCLDLFNNCRSRMSFYHHGVSLKCILYISVFGICWIIFAPNVILTSQGESKMHSIDSWMLTCLDNFCPWMPLYSHRVSLKCILSISFFGLVLDRFRPECRFTLTGWVESEIQTDELAAQMSLYPLPVGLKCNLTLNIYMNWQPKCHFTLCPSG